MFLVVVVVIAACPCFHGDWKCNTDIPHVFLLRSKLPEFIKMMSDHFL
uniref:Uncharacterized protein n=1 Tax=Anguilla anguilla TaxID=7936 RepID=A0A0E9PF16_ANGAN